MTITLPLIRHGIISVSKVIIIGIKKPNIKEAIILKATKIVLLYTNEIEN
jgi:hypothetical protein